MVPEAAPLGELHWGLLYLLVRLKVLDGRFILALDATFVPKSGRKTAGLGAFWNGASHRSETGLELSCLALLSWSGHHAFPVQVQQTQPRREKHDRLEQYQAQLVAFLEQRRTWLQQHLRVVVADGQYAKTMFMDAVSREGYAFVTKLQCNANLLSPFSGPHPKRRGGRQKWAGKVDFKSFDGWASVPGEKRERVWTQVAWAPHYKRFLRVVVIQNLNRRGEVQGHVVLCSTDTAMPAQQIRSLYSARFRLEFVFRDVKQFAGLNTCQLRSSLSLENHWNAALFAVSLGRAEVLLDDAGRCKRPASWLPCSYEDVKRRAYNQLFAHRILRHLGLAARFDELQNHPASPLHLGVKVA
ncbi:transposase [Deinococcus multiflagellatus]|uniref:Transposase n=1 Tax=Deinococcus multiflagellatus TaxID=1656887 RepID=A0ABW1ZSY9_9DEIO